MKHTNYAFKILLKTLNLLPVIYTIIANGLIIIIIIIMASLYVFVSGKASPFKGELSYEVISLHINFKVSLDPSKSN